MTITNALRGVTRIGLDSAPFIYYLEGTLVHFPHCVRIFTAIEGGRFSALTSTITLTETLVHPLQSGDVARASLYRNLILKTSGITTTPVTAAIGEQAADLRARYNLRTPDAIHLATAIDGQCDAFVTNDFDLRRVTEIRVIALGELTL